MNKVYVTNRGGHDYSAAERYGTLIFCTEGIIPRYNTSHMFREIEQAMSSSTPEDYILLTSLTTLNAIACGYFAHKHGRLNLLLFQARQGKTSEGDYLERIVVFEHVDFNGNEGAEKEEIE